MQVVVTGIGLVTALGATLTESFTNLIAGNTGIKLHQPFWELGKLPLAMLDTKPTPLTAITAELVKSALLDAGLSLPLVDAGVVIGSSRGFQSQWEKMLHHRAMAKLGDWLDSLPHMNAIAAARQIGTTGIVQAPMAACATGLVAIAQGSLLIQSGQCDRVLVGGVESPITPLTITGFAQMGALAQTGAYPFDSNREGLVLGEGGAILVLESLELAQQRQAKIYGEILGYAIANDAYHPNAPEPTGKSAIRTIRQALERSRIQPEQIDYIHAHGTATIRNDAVENEIIQTIFNHQPYVSSTKGATGHTIGASGALGAAFCLMALQQQILPPCVGLRSSEFNLNLLTQAQTISVSHALCLSFGFGGTNTAIVLGRLPI